VAKAKKLQGVVITQLAVGADCSVQNVKILRTPDAALANAAIHTVHTWRFKPAHNFQGQSVPVVVDVAVAFRLDIVPKPAASISSRPAPGSAGSIAAANTPDKKL
jgi:TonB family protein